MRSHDLSLITSPASGNYFLRRNDFGISALCGAAPLHPRRDMAVEVIGVRNYRAEPEINNQDMGSALDIIYREVCDSE